MDKAKIFISENTVKLLTTIILGLAVWILKTTIDLKVMVSETQVNSVNQDERIKANEQNIRALFSFHYKPLN